MAFLPSDMREIRLIRQYDFPKKGKQMDAMTTQALTSQDECGVLTVDLGALARNYQRLCAMAAPSDMAAVVKADGYGLGADVVSKVFYQQGCRTFFVAHFIEAVALRPALPVSWHFAVMALPWLF